jgi:hypothetical protein
MIQSSRYSIEAIQNQARRLVKRNVISRQQCIYELCKYIPASRWADVERELENSEFLLRDRIADLIGDEEWQND